MDVSLDRALAWRLERQFLRDGAGAGSATEVVRRLSAVPAMSGDPGLAIRRRLRDPGPDPVGAALEGGELLCTYAFRGATHLMAAGDAGAFMAIRGASAQWMRASWRREYGLGRDDWEALRKTARAVVADGPVGRGAFIAALAAEPRFRHLRDALAHPSHTLLKPLAWQGDVCFGPPRDGEWTYKSPASSPHWQGLPEVDEAGRRAVRLYLSGYGPATRANLDHWLVAGLNVGRRRLDRWLEDLSDEVAEVRVDGVASLHLRDELDALAAARVDPEELTLLPGYDQWVLGPGTADERIVPAAHRAAVSRGATLLLRGGRLVGSWRVEADEFAASWFAGEHPAAVGDLRAAAERLEELLPRRSRRPHA